VADSQPGLTATNDDHVNPLAQVEPRRPDRYPTSCLLKTEPITLGDVLMPFKRPKTYGFSGGRPDVRPYSPPGERAAP
jgi:hypothetical protein